MESVKAHRNVAETPETQRVWRKAPPLRGRGVWCFRNEKRSDRFCIREMWLMAHADFVPRQGMGLLPEVPSGLSVASTRIPGVTFYRLQWRRPCRKSGSGFPALRKPRKCLGSQRHSNVPLNCTGKPTLLVEGR